MRYRLCEINSEYYPIPVFRIISGVRTGIQYKDFKSLRIAKSVAHRWHKRKLVIITDNKGTHSYRGCCNQEH